MPKVAFALDLLPRTVEVLSARDSVNSAELTVFLGIYNAKPFMADLLTSIRNQTWTRHVNLLIVDNDSADDSLRILLESLPEMDCQITIVRNQTNVGALGSLYRNADLVETEWLTFMHQDDVYLSNFLDSCLREARAAAAEKISTISFDYFTVEGDAKPDHVPNPTWFAKGAPGYRVFQESLANHSIPWPCSVFRTNYLLEEPVPFHSAAFLDTEIALNHAGDGASRYVAEVVMNYRIHGESGSHSLPTAEAEILRCSSMLRVFNSHDFHDLVRTVPLDAQEEWAVSLVESTLNYVRSERLKDLMVISLLESIVFALNYMNHQVNQLLAAELSRIGAKGASSIVMGIRSSAQHEIPKSKFIQESGPHVQELSSKQDASWARKIAMKLPRTLLRLLFRAAPKRFIPHPWSQYK